MKEISEKLRSEFIIKTEKTIEEHVTSCKRETLEEVEKNEK